jgi:hypothetical protein
VPTTPFQKLSERELQPFGSRAVVAGAGGAILPGGNASDAGGTNAELHLPQNIYLNTAAFGLPAPFAFGTARRNDAVGPGLVDIDFSLQKKWAVHESTSLQFRFDAWNALKNPNFNLPGRNFGRVIMSAQDPSATSVCIEILVLTFDPEPPGRPGYPHAPQIVGAEFP